MSASVGDKVKVTAGDNAGLSGVVEQQHGLRSCVRLPDSDADWPFPHVVWVPTEDLQRVAR